MISLSLAKTYAIQPSELKEEKIYVTPDQIVITEEGIFAYLPNSQEPVEGNALALDGNGLYLSRMVLQRGPCYLHNLWCAR